MQAIAKKIQDHQFFEPFIIGVILFSAVLIGLETSKETTIHYAGMLATLDIVIIGIFMVEALIKMIALWPRPQDYFREGWNVFDFSIIVLSLMPATGEFAMIARLARLLRVLRLISMIPELRIIVATLLRSLPSMGHIMLLMSIIFYIYAVAGYHLFHAHDPQHWGSLSLALLSLFRIVTLEDWTDLMYTGMEVAPYMAFYFISFVVVGTFVIVNLFIAVVINNLEEAKQERLEGLVRPQSNEDLLMSLKATQDRLAQLQSEIESHTSAFTDKK